MTAVGRENASRYWHEGSNPSHVRHTALHSHRSHCSRFNLVPTKRLSSARCHARIQRRASMDASRTEAFEATERLAETYVAMENHDSVTAAHHGRPALPAYISKTEPDRPGFNCPDSMEPIRTPWPVSTSLYQQPFPGGAVANRPNRPASQHRGTQLNEAGGVLQDSYKDQLSQ